MKYFSDVLIDLLVDVLSLSLFLQNCEGSSILLSLLFKCGVSLAACFGLLGKVWRFLRSHLFLWRIFWWRLWFLIDFDIIEICFLDDCIFAFFILLAELLLAHSVIILLLLIWINLKGIILHRKRLLLLEIWPILILLLFLLLHDLTLAKSKEIVLSILFQIKRLLHFLFRPRRLKPFKVNYLVRLKHLFRLWFISFIDLVQARELALSIIVQFGWRSSKLWKFFHSCLSETTTQSLFLLIDVNFELSFLLIQESQWRIVVFTDNAFV